MKRFNELIQKRWFANTLAGCITVAFFIILSNINDVWNGITQFMNYFSTIIGGCVLAYLMNPLAKLYQRLLFRKIKKESLGWSLSIVFAVVTVLMFLIFIMSILIPQLIDSVATFINNLDSYAATLQGLIHDFMPEDHESPSLQNIVLSSDNIINTVVDYIMDNSSKIINISTTAGKSVINWFIAFVLSIYLLAAKNKLKASTKRFLNALLSTERYNTVSTFLTRCNLILNRYVIFDLIDGLIVGTVNAVFMSALGMQYAGLVSVVVGVTNLVPAFGPLIGAVIGGFILLMVQPVHALIFIVFTLVLQFLDGYVIKPKLFGNTLGVPGLWILIMIIAGGRIYGIVGILLAIPSAAILDYIYREIIISNLEKRKTRINAPPAEEEDDDAEDIKG